MGCYNWHSQLQFWVVWTAEICLELSKWIMQQVPHLTLDKSRQVLLRPTTCLKWVHTSAGSVGLGQGQARVRAEDLNSTSNCFLQTVTIRYFVSTTSITQLTLWSFGSYAAFWIMQPLTNFWQERMFVIEKIVLLQEFLFSDGSLWGLRTGKLNRYSPS